MKKQKYLAFIYRKMKEKNLAFLGVPISHLSILLIHIALLLLSPPPQLYLISPEKWSLTQRKRAPQLEFSFHSLWALTVIKLWNKSRRSLLPLKTTESYQNPARYTQSHMGFLVRTRNEPKGTEKQTSFLGFLLYYLVNALYETLENNKREETHKR